MRLFLVVVVLVVVGLGLGYYFGQGSEPALQQNTSDSTPTSKMPSKVESADALIGLWRSVDDPKFTREFTKDSVVDRYSGQPDATMEASWSFMSQGDDTGPIRISPDRNYIKMVTPEEVMFFSIDLISASELQMTYADGGVLRFKKVR